jgi:hypothetical protein
MNFVMRSGGYDVVADASLGIEGGVGGKFLNLETAATR